MLFSNGLTNREVTTVCGEVTSRFYPGELQSRALTFGHSNNLESLSLCFGVPLGYLFM